MSLDDDIARVARLRGKDPSTYLGDKPAPQLGRPQLSRLFEMSSDFARDIEAYDRLPKRSREEIDAADRPLNSRVWLGFLQQLDGDEGALISQWRAYLAWCLGREYKALVRRDRKRGRPL